ncbi:MAG: hypothetical protein DRQ10_05030, partial [Candidatus Hydrothermota bacterium]
MNSRFYKPVIYGLVLSFIVAVSLKAQLKAIGSKGEMSADKIDNVAAVQSDDKSVPPYLNYQGFIVSTDGDTVAITDTLPMRFSIYDSLVAGHRLWGPSLDTVAVIGGFFNARLGPIDPSIFTGRELFLEVEINYNGTWYRMTPRKPIGTVGYAMRALIGGGWHEQNTNSYTYNFVGIGTNMPAYNLHVEGDAYITGDILVDHDITVNGMVDIGEDLDVARDAYIGQTLYVNNIDPFGGANSIAFSAPISVRQIFVDWIDPRTLNEVNFSAPVRVGQIYVDWIDPDSLNTVNFSAPIRVEQVYTDWIDPLNGDTVYFSAPIWAPNLGEVMIPETIRTTQIFVDWIDPRSGGVVQFSAPIRVPGYVETDTVYAWAGYFDKIDPRSWDYIMFSAPISVDQIYTNAIDAITDTGKIYFSSPIRVDSIFSHQIYVDWIDPLSGDTVYFSAPIWAPNLGQAEIPDTIIVSQIYVNWIDPRNDSLVRFSAPILAHKAYINYIDPYDWPFVEFSAP